MIRKASSSRNCAKPTIGIAGLGTVGTALATSLLKRGHAVAVWNRTAAKSQKFARCQPVRVMRSIAELAAQSDVLIACLTDHSATMKVIATESAAATLRGKLLLQTATVTSREARELAAWASEHAIAYLDCQILDYVGDVRDGKGTLACSGPASLFDQHRDFLEAIAGTALYVGETVGSAPALDKAVLAFGCGIYSAFLQGAAMCRAAGVPIDLFLQRELTYLESGHLASDFKGFARMIEKGSYDADPQAYLQVWAAALKRAIDQCEETGVDAAQLRAIGDCMHAAIEKGHGTDDFPALFETLVAGRPPDES